MLKLVQVDNGVFDLAFDDPTLDDADAAVASVVYAVLFTDAEAPTRVVLDRYDRRGWWVDPQRGSGLWYVRRQPLGSAARRETLDMVEMALTRRDPALTEVKITELEQPLDAGSVSSMFLQITGKHNGRSFLIKTPL